MLFQIASESEYQNNNVIHLEIYAEKQRWPQEKRE